MKPLYFDTETTGLPLFKEPSSHPDQPHIVQLAWIMSGVEHNHIIKPDGWNVPDAAAAIHGITTEVAMELGLPLGFVLGLFAAHLQHADIVIGHNVSFDARLIRIQCERIGIPDLMEGKQKYCTMSNATKIVKCPPTAAMQAKGMTQFKSPNLQETYTHFYGKPFEGAHDALADVRACRDVYIKLNEAA